MKQSYLINDRIYLRAVEPEDIDVMYEMENDPSMWDISSFTVPYSRYVLRQYIEGSQSDMFADKQLRLMIIRREDNRTIGTDRYNRFCSFTFAWRCRNNAYMQIVVVPDTLPMH